MLNQRIMKDGGGVELEVCSMCKWLHGINGSGHAIAMHCTGATGFQQIDPEEISVSLCKGHRSCSAERLTERMPPKSASCGFLAREPNISSSTRLLPVLF